MLKASADKTYINLGNPDILKLITRHHSIILDVGCGAGGLAGILLSNGHIVDGITISSIEYKTAQKFIRNIFIHDLETGLPEDILELKYDYVVCSHVLEHIVYPDKLLKDIYKILKPQGCLLIALPNIMLYKSRLKLISGKFEYEIAGIWDNTHVKWYTFESAKRLLLDHNYFIEMATVTGEIPFNGLFSKIFPPFLRKSIFNFIIKISKGFFGYQLLFKVRKNGFI